MARFFTIASSSSGNASFAGCGDGGILIDAGVCCKGILKAFEDRQIDPKSLFGVLITHEHTDHIKGLMVFLKKHNIPLYSSAPVLEYLINYNLVPEGAILKEMNAEGEALGSIMVNPFRTSHDSVCSFGYRLTMPDERVITIATDTGYVTSPMRQSLLGSDLVLIESNYEPGMLENGRYPYMLKRRIAGPCGHLANEDCAMELAALVRNKTTRIILGHLSLENNLPGLARETALSALTIAGMKENDDYMLSVAPRAEMSPLMVL